MEEEQRMKRDRRKEQDKKKKQKESRVEVEPKPSAAVPCHISAEHDSRTVWSGNDLGFSLVKYKQGGAACFMRTWISEISLQGLEEAAGCFYAPRERERLIQWQESSHGGRKRDKRP